jgi:nucleotide-binding universal stress UspA family protein
VRAPNQRNSGPSRLEYVIGVDGSAASIAAARWAIDRAARDGAALVVVHAYQVTALPSVAGPVRTPAMRRAAHERATKLLAGAMDALPPGAISEQVLMEGPADRVLIERSAGSALLVLGARPQHTHPHMRFLGSTALRCLRGAGCPVVLVPSELGELAVARETAGAVPVTR